MEVEDEYFKIEEVASRFKVGKAAVNKWLRQGKLGYVVVGGERRVPTSALKKFIEDSTREYEEKRETPGLTHMTVSAAL